MMPSSSRPTPAIDGVDIAHADGVLDCIDFPQAQPWQARLMWMVLAVLLGVSSGLLMAAQLPRTYALWSLVLPLTFVGGLLSTWSPCGYSSLSLLRPAGRYSAKQVLRWSPTLFMHAIGYAIGALVLGGALGMAGYFLLGQLPLSTSGLVLAVLALAYGVHQFNFLKMPYPQRRAQVPHDARFRFSPWVIGLLYGFALGMNYLTYVQTPILYIASGAALFSANAGSALVIIGAFNIGRFLPMLVNFLPVSDRGVQAWLARWQERAVTIDGFLLLMAGSAALVVCLS